MTLLKIGSKGEAVRELQRQLNKAAAVPTLGVDGNFGDKTDKAVRHIQQRLGLVVDGKAGTNTLKALKQLNTPAKPTARPEPDKSAMASTSPAAVASAAVGAKAPANFTAANILDTTRKLIEIILHCTATPEGKHFTVDDVRAWHKQRGFSDVGYHFLIYPDGRIMLGRPLGQIGSHVQGHNTGTIGIAYFGGLTSDSKTAKDTRTPEQKASTLWLVGQLKKKFPTIAKVTGHNQYANKACPCFKVPNDPVSKLAA